MVDKVISRDGYFVVGKEKYEVRIFTRCGRSRKDPVVSIVFVDKRTGIGKRVRCYLRPILSFFRREAEKYRLLK